MADHGKIHRHFHKHPKVQRCSLAAIGLWTICNSWTRDNRTAGLVPTHLTDRLDPSGELCIELVCERLWLHDKAGYRFNDYAEHNGDVQPGNTAARLVQETLGDRFPNAVRTSVSAKVSELLEEGQEVSVIKEGLKLWAARPSAHPNLLPHLVADAIRDHKNVALVKLIKDALGSNDITPLRRYGYWFEYPAAPLNMSTQEVTEFMIAAQREWLIRLQGELDW